MKNILVHLRGGTMRDTTQRLILLTNLLVPISYGVYWLLKHVFPEPYVRYTLYALAFAGTLALGRWMHAGVEDPPDGHKGRSTRR